MMQVPSGLDRLIARSLEVIEAGQAGSGAYVAAPSFPIYRYSWLRDGAFIADAMSRHGRRDSAERFHRWAGRVVADRSQRIAELVARGRSGGTVEPEEHLHTRYTLDGREADGFWENFQLDGYGTWLWALRRHHDRHPQAEGPSLAPVAATVAYLAAFWEQPSYDWWEEHPEHQHVSTLASIWAGLQAVAGWDAVDAGTRDLACDAAGRIRVCIDRDGVVDGSLVKWLGSTQVDASLIACLTPFDLYPPEHPVAAATLERVDTELAPGGVHRYLDDVYYGGGQWVLLAALLAWHHLRAGGTERAGQLLSWIVEQADESGDLPEQVAEDLLHPDELQGWEERWGPSARPLLWSHAMLLDLAAALPEPGSAGRG